MLILYECEQSDKLKYLIVICSMLFFLFRPLNPLGSRPEIMQTVVWIQTHLEEDVEVSLPKQEVYEEYGYLT
jgi:hypothetical protein